MRRTFLLVVVFLFISGVLLGQNCPSITLSSTSGTTCGLTPITVSQNTFAGDAMSVTIEHNGDGTVMPALTLNSPFSFTYTPGNRDNGNVVTITITTDNFNVNCLPASQAYTLTVESVPREPRIGAITQPACLVSTGSVVLSDLPPSGWTITRSPGGVTTTGTGASTTVSEIPAGTYTFMVTSAGGCLSPVSNPVVINAQPPSPGVPAVSVDCSPGNTSVSVVSPTGAGLQYRLDGGNYQNGILFNNVSVGSHNVTVRNTFGCETTGPAFQVFASPSAPLIGTVTQPSCSVGSGSIVLTGLPSGSWTITRLPGGATTTGSGSSSTISALAAGTYSFTVTNSGGCTSGASASVTINSPFPIPTAPVVGTITQPTCTVPTGSVVLTGLPISGTWILVRTPGNVSSTGSGAGTTVSGLTTGTYTFRVTNSVGCISASSGNVVINAQGSPPSAPVVGAITAPTCSSPTGSVVLSGLPSSGSWTLMRNPGNISTSGTGTSTTVTGITSGTYTFTVTNSGGCTSPATASVVVPASPSTPSAPLIGLITQPRFESPTGSVIVNGLPASGTWTLTMSPGDIRTTGTGTTTTVSGLLEGIYSFTVTNSLGCTSAPSASFQISEVTGPPQVTITNPAPVCAPSTVNITLPAVTAGSTPNLLYTYWLDLAATRPFTTPGAAVSGTYFIKGTTSDGFFTVRPVVVTVYQMPVANAGSDQNLPYVFETRMNAILVNDFESGVWSLVSGNGNLLDNTEPKTQVTGLSLGKNKFNWTVTNGVCPSTVDSVSINVGDYGTQTLMTPNMDGKNDYFILKRTTSSTIIMNLIIFDRRGAQVYKNSNYDNSWDGVNNNGDPLPDDTYFYVAKNSDGTSLNGYIVIRRSK